MIGFDWQSIVSGIVCGVTAGLAAIRLASRRWDRMEQKVENLEKDEMAGIKKRLDAYENRCQQHQDKLAARLGTLDQLAADERNTVGWLRKLDSKLDRIAESSAAVAAGQIAQDKWLANLDAQHQAHVHNMGIHRRD